MAFAIQGTFILVAPALFAASIYMILGRLIRTCRAEHLSLIPSKPAAPASLLPGLRPLQLGEKVIIGGLFVQIVVFGFFVCTSVLFIPSDESPTLSRSRSSAVRALYVLYGTSAIILVRSIFRVIEYIQGNDGYLITHEVYLYIFDALLMAAVMAIFIVWYVGDLESKKKRKGANMDSLHSSDGIVEMGSRGA
ncbi:RTA1 [Verticillium alfalfae VaMs.102]|uniref:RTA1 n=1 Tax=Verticillium alfalfae (strain VaMs.102 / ATCC MYA-4576 / FGSC 10136) TaxID=526221 RepID=C9SH88_VERA1|nr:RTA1 [Verticillium alfalfae VaMs.102]EEY17682.1 RTA1 [Verticillium alfalfae VaMs.102]